MKQHGPLGPPDWTSCFLTGAASLRLPCIPMPFWESIKHSLFDFVLYNIMQCKHHGVFELCPLMPHFSLKSHLANLALFYEVYMFKSAASASVNPVRRFGAPFPSQCVFCEGEGGLLSSASLDQGAPRVLPRVSLAFPHGSTSCVGFGRLQLCLMKQCLTRLCN